MGNSDRTGAGSGHNLMAVRPEGFTALRLPPEGASVSHLRRRVAATLSQWDKPDLIDDAVLCAGELASNAILHTRRPYDVTVRRAGDGVRVEVIDSQPRLVPLAVPTLGTATDITGTANTGRGLRIIATLASRWGYTTTNTAKSVWAELSASSQTRNSAPVIVVGNSARSPGPLKVRLRAMPVRLAVMSGVQVDELVREIQLRPDGTVSAEERTVFYELLDRSAHVRLDGRYAALRAASQSTPRFDLDLATTAEALEATRLLTDQLEQFAQRVPESLAAVTPGVAGYRAWLLQEFASQLGGHRPSACPIPDE
jgi:anti-sigma regulatory factor (Ser/Thr protein kinase)